MSGSDWQDSNANTTGYRGTHAGKLAHEAGWENSDVANAPGNINYTERNASGFSAVAAGGAFVPVGAEVPGGDRRRVASRDAVHLDLDPDGLLLHFLDLSLGSGVHFVFLRVLNVAVY